MTTIWLVYQDNEDSQDVVGAYSSFDKARASIPDDKFWDGTQALYPWFAQSIREIKVN